MSNLYSIGSLDVADISIGGHIIPKSNELYDLGTSQYRFRDLYLSGNTINIGDQSISVNSNGQIDVGSNVFAVNVLGINISASSNLTTPSLTATSITSGSINATTLGVAGSAQVAGNVQVAGTMTAGTLAGKIDDDIVRIGMSNAAAVYIGTADRTQTINIGTGDGITTINIGGAGDTVNIAGTLTAVNTSNTTVNDKLLTLNRGGADGSAGGAGFTIEEGFNQVAEVMITSDRAAWRLGVPSSEGKIRLYPGSAGFDISASNMWTASGSNVVRSSGGVAIGKASAAYSLDVVGDINFTGQLRSNGQLVSLIGNSNATGADNYVYKNVTVSNTYAITNADTTLTEFTMTITPTSINAEIELKYMINYEGSHTMVFQLYRNGVKIGNHTNAGQIWAGTAPSEYDQNTGDTMVQTIIDYVDSPSTTSPVTYTLTARSSVTSNTSTLYLNRTATADGQSGNENTISHAFARQLGGAITLAQAFQTSNNVVYLSNGSNLAIGKSNAAYALDVQGDVNVSGNFKVNGTNLANASSQWTTTGNNIYYSAGNVGVGVTSPTAPLQVQNYQFHSFTRSLAATLNAATNICTITNNAFVDLDINQTEFGNSWSKHYTFNVAWNTTAGAWHRMLPLNNLTYTSDVAVDIRVQDNLATLRLVRTVVGAYSENSVNNIVCNIRVSGTSAATPVVTGDSTTSTGVSNAQVYANTVLTQHYGKVGIGVAAPSQPLHVAGVAQASSFYSADHSAYLTPTTVNGNYFLATGDNVYRTVGNVGLGTTTPAYKLHVVDSTRGILRLEETSVGQQYNAVQFYGPSTSCEIGHRTDTGLMYFANPANFGETNAKMVITSSGSVGVGTTNPQTPLHVMGAITAGGNTGFKLNVLTGTLPARSSTATIAYPSGVTRDQVMFYWGQSQNTANGDWVPWDYRGDDNWTVAYYASSGGIIVNPSGLLTGSQPYKLMVVST